MKPISLRVGERTLYLIDTLAEGREDPISEARRRAIQLGARVYAILGPPNEDTGYYGDYTPETLVREIRPLTVSMIDFLRKNGEDITSFMSQLGITVTPSGQTLSSSQIQQDVKQQLQSMDYNEDILNAVDDIGVSLEE